MKLARSRLRTTAVKGTAAWSSWRVATATKGGDALGLERRQRTGAGQLGNRMDGQVPEEKYQAGQDHKSHEQEWGWGSWIVALEFS